MVKKLLLAVLLGGFFSGIGAEESDVMEELLQRVDLVLFLLEQNTVRMERYSLNELQSDINFVSKDLSRKHCVFTMSMTEKDSKPRTIAWDQEQLDRIKILSGNKKAPKTSYLLLEKLIPSDVPLKDFAMVCFDCNVNFSKAPKNEAPTTKADWRSTIDIMMPAGQQELTIQLVVDGRVKAASGLFVQSDLFDKALLCGEVKRQEALDLGVLITQEVVQKTPAKTVSPSLAGRISSGFTASLDTVARFFNTSWKKAWSYVS